MSEPGPRRSPEAPVAAAPTVSAAASAPPAEAAADRTLALRVFRGDAKDGRLEEYTVPISPGMVVLDAVHWIQAHRAPDLAVRWNCKARSAARVAPRSTVDLRSCASRGSITCRPTSR
jgi:hypothetical protein